MALPLNSVEEAKAAAEMLSNARVDFLKIYGNLSASQFEAIADVAKRRGITFAGHIPTRISLEQVSAAGQKSVEHADLAFVADCIPDGKKAIPAMLNAWIKGGFPAKYEQSSRWWAKRDQKACLALYRRMAERQTWATPVVSHEIKGGEWTTPDDLAVLPDNLRKACVSSRASMDFNPALRDAVARQVLDLVRDMHEAGVPLLAGSDVPNECLWHGRSLHKELRLLARAGLSNWETLKTATLNPARFLGRADEGVVRPGAKANLLLLDADPLADIANTMKIRGVMLKGRWHDAAALAAMRAEARSRSEPAVALYENAMVWNGSGFERRTLAVRRGRFVAAVQEDADAARTDLAGGFVVPAYANAHAHVTPGNEKGSWSYLQNGVFYVWNPNTTVLGPSELDFFKRPDSYDVATSQGGITEPGGHPQKLYVDLLPQWVPDYKGKTLKDFLGNAFHYGRTPKEIDASLDLLKSQKADFVKAYLLNSEEYQARRDDPKSYGNKGLNPTNFSYLVSAARQRGLPVAVHVETAHDLKIAALSRAAMAAHLPAYWDIKNEKDLRSRTLTPSDAKIVARSGMLLVATYGIAGERYKAAEKKGALNKNMSSRVLAVQAHNIRLLKEAGARFITGTDGSGQIFDEVEHLVSIGALTNDEALAVTLRSGRHLFPMRRIGCLEVGCEADFLVLSADPSREISSLRKIRQIVKAGTKLQAPPDGRPSP
jgi:imidazolonepropionase-like amidohydrolase